MVPRKSTRESGHKIRVQHYFQSQTPGALAGKIGPKAYPSGESDSFLAEMELCLHHLNCLRQVAPSLPGCGREALAGHGAVIQVYSEMTVCSGDPRNPTNI